MRKAAQLEPMKPMAPLKRLASIRPFAPLSGDDRWWPETLGEPASSGSQNGIRYAFFAKARRLLVEDANGRTTYDSGAHRISGVSQQDGRDRTVRFTSQNSLVKLEEMTKL